MKKGSFGLVVLLGVLPAIAAGRAAWTPVPVQSGKPYVYVRVEQSTEPQLIHFWVRKTALDGGSATSRETLYCTAESFSIDSVVDRDGHGRVTRRYRVTQGGRLIRIIATVAFFDPQRWVYTQYCPEGDRDFRPN